MMWSSWHGQLSDTEISTVLSVVASTLEENVSEVDGNEALWMS